MDKEGALAALAILVLAGVLVYGYKTATTVGAANAQNTMYGSEASAAMNVIQSEILAAGTQQAFNSGPAIYLAQTPYLFNVPIGNIIPSTSPSNTLPGSVPPYVMLPGST
jgi:hypothetical protein